MTRIRKIYLLLIILTSLLLLLINVYRLKFNPSIKSMAMKKSRWKKDRLVVIPAIFKEINWSNHSSWPQWLRNGLDIFNKNETRPYDIYLYQRIDPNCKSPFNWPYAKNVREESGVYLKFIYDFYHDLPDKMLFIHANPFQHSLNPFDTVQCIRDDVYYTSINFLWIQNRPWTSPVRDPIDNQTLIYKCAKYLLSLFGFDGESQLNPTNIKPNEFSLISAMCCAQFYVRKERISHYTYKQWSSIYNASVQLYCTSTLDYEITGGPGTKYFGGSLEFLWHVLLGFYPTYMPPPTAKTNTDLCHYFRPSCKGTLCRDAHIQFLVHQVPNSNNTN